MKKILAFAALSLIAPGLQAQDAYPTKPITMIAPFPPGGVADIVGRPLAASMEKTLKQPVLVVNRSGAGGAVGTTAAAKAAPDGYTILMSLSSISIFPVSDPINGRPAPYRLSDFAPIPLVTADPTILVAAADGRYQTIQDFIAAATPAPVIQRLRDAVRAAVADPMFKDAMDKVQTPVSYLDAPDFRAFLAKDAARLKIAVEKIGRVDEK